MRSVDQPDGGDNRAATAAVGLAANKIAFAELLPAVPGAVVPERAGLRFVDTGIADATFNGVIHAPAEERSFTAAVAEVTAHFRSRSLPFHWRLGLHDEPAEAAGLLVAAGMHHEETEPAMWLDLATPPAQLPGVGGLTVRPVTGTARLREWVTVWGCGAPTDVTDRWYQVYSALPYGPDGALRMFVAYLDGTPAATVYVFLAAGVAAVEYVVTRPEYRRRGIGAAMTALAVDEARRAGYPVAVLTASPSGEPIYRRLGFRECGAVHTYVWTAPA